MQGFFIIFGSNKYVIMKRIPFFATLLSLCALLLSCSDDDKKSSYPDGASWPTEYLGSWMIVEATSEGAEEDMTLRYSGQHVIILTDDEVGLMFDSTAVAVGDLSIFSWYVDDLNRFCIDDGYWEDRTRNTLSITGSEWIYRQQVGPQSYLTSRLEKIEEVPADYIGSWSVTNARRARNQTEMITESFDWENHASTVTSDYTEKKMVIDSEGNCTDMLDHTYHLVVAGECFWCYTISSEEGLVATYMHICNNGGASDELWLIYYEDAYNAYRFILSKD